jgi:hypothetical protein
MAELLHPCPTRENDCRLTIDFPAKFIVVNLGHSAHSITVTLKHTVTLTGIVTNEYVLDSTICLCKPASATDLRVLQ